MQENCKVLGREKNEIGTEKVEVEVESTSISERKLGEGCEYEYFEKVEEYNEIEEFAFQVTRVMDKDLETYDDAMESKDKKKLKAAVNEELVT